jgi:hypothetical protein
VPNVDLSVEELKVLHNALVTYIQDGASGLSDCECRALRERLRRILTWGTGYHLPVNRRATVNSK